MPQSPEAESRTAALGRKRKRELPPVDMKAYRDTGGRRDSSISKESGEVSTSYSAESRRLSDHPSSSDAGQDVLDPTLQFGEGEAASGRRRAFRNSHVGDLDASSVSNKAQTAVGDRVKAAGRMTLADLPDDPVRVAVRKRCTERPNDSIESVVRSFRYIFQPYNKAIRRFLENWDRKHGVNPPSYTELEDLLSRPKNFVKPLDYNAMSERTYRALRTAVQEEAVKRPRDTIAQLVLRYTVADQEPERVRLRARQIIDEYIASNYTGPDAASVDRGVDKGETDIRHKKTSRSGSAAEPIEIDRDPEPVCAGNDQRQTLLNNYGRLAREAASRSTVAAPSMLTLSDIQPDEQALQYRYFHLSDPNAYVRCLCCGQVGHMGDDCPEQTCKYCGEEHFAGACPVHSKCDRCRQRGHGSRACKNRVANGGSLQDPCDICGHAGHYEEECPRLGRSYEPKQEEIVGMPQGQMIFACYNCGATGPQYDYGRAAHFGDDCPDLPPYMKRKVSGHRMWSADNAMKYLQEDEGPRSYDAGASGGSGHGADAYYQFSAFDDMRD